jgi:hypothetical protein
MICIHNWRDLQAFGIDYLTGESCGYMYRGLFDVTARGKKILEQYFAIKELQLAEPWNRGDPSDPHVGSIMMSPELIKPIAAFALLDAGCTEVWLFKDSSSVEGIEKDNDEEMVDYLRKIYMDRFDRILRAHGTAGDRNIHAMSGRVE